MACPDFEKKVYLYLSGELNRSEKNVFKLHLKECAICEKEFNKIKETWSAMTQLPVEEPGPETRKTIEKYLAGSEEYKTIDRIKMFRLIENLVLGRAAVGYLTESMHGAGSPQAQRIMISRLAKVGEKKKMAKILAEIDEE